MTVRYMEFAECPNHAETINTARGRGTQAADTASDTFLLERRLCRILPTVNYCRSRPSRSIVISTSVATDIIKVNTIAYEYWQTWNINFDVISRQSNVTVVMRIAYWSYQAAAVN